MVQKRSAESRNSGTRETETRSYEVIEQLTNDSGDEMLGASYTANNGIRLEIRNKFSDEWDDCWRVFSLTSEQAERVGNSLLRWAREEEGNHDSDCALHNAPALPVGPCNCSLSDREPRQ